MDMEIICDLRILLVWKLLFFMLSGYIGGSHYSNPGGGANYLCIVSNPVFDDHVKPSCGYSDIYGTEYEVCPQPQHDMSSQCAVCRIPSRSTILMVPGRYNSDCVFGKKENQSTLYD